MMMKKRHTLTLTLESCSVFLYFLLSLLHDNSTNTVANNPKLEEKRNIFIFDILVLFSVAYFLLALLLCMLRSSNRVVNHHFGRLMCVVSGFFSLYLLPLSFTTLHLCSTFYLSSLQTIPMSLSIFCSNFTHSFIILFLLLLLLRCRCYYTIIHFICSVNFISLNVQFVGVCVCSIQMFSHMVYINSKHLLTLCQTKNEWWEKNEREWI